VPPTEADPGVHDIGTQPDRPRPDRPRPDSPPPDGMPATAPGGRRRASSPLPPSPAAARLARELVRRLTGGPEHVQVALIVTELVTNAVTHAAAAPTFTAGFDGTTVRVEVFDDGPGRPRLCRVDATATSGRGIALVDAVADRWGVDEVDGGKTVWAEVDTTP
jgi:anti-sigma regulatory factor (Ser/Thr protein kinase)